MLQARSGTLVCQPPPPPPPPVIQTPPKTAPRSDAPHPLLSSPGGLGGPKGFGGNAATLGPPVFEYGLLTSAQQREKEQWRKRTADQSFAFLFDTSDRPAEQLVITVGNLSWARSKLFEQADIGFWESELTVDQDAAEPASEPSSEEDDVTTQVMLLHKAEKDFFFKELKNTVQSLRGSTIAASVLSSVHDMTMWLHKEREDLNQHMQSLLVHREQAAQTRCCMEGQGLTVKLKPGEPQHYDR